MPCSNWTTRRSAMFWGLQAHPNHARDRRPAHRRATYRGDNTMPDDVRDRIWTASWNTKYDALYQAFFSLEMTTRWQRFSEVTSLLVAVTASGSAVSALTLWQDDGFKWIWQAVASSAAVIAIASTVLGADGRVRAWSESYSHFIQLYHDLESLELSMTMNPSFNVEEMRAALERHRQTYRSGLTVIPSDIFVTRRIQERSQRNVDQKLGSGGK